MIKNDLSRTWGFILLAFGLMFLAAAVINPLYSPSLPFVFGIASLILIVLGILAIVQKKQQS